MYFIDCQANMDTINILFYCLKKINVLIYVLINFIGQNKFGVTKFLNIFYWSIKIKKKRNHMVPKVIMVL